MRIAPGGQIKTVAGGALQRAALPRQRRTAHRAAKGCSILFLPFKKREHGSRFSRYSSSPPIPCAFMYSSKLANF